MLSNIERLRGFMAENGIDAVIATSPENVAYLAEYYCASQWLTKGTQAYAVVAADDSAAPFVVLPSLEIEALAEVPSWITDLRPYGLFFREFASADAITSADDKAIVELSRSTATQASAVDMLIAVLAEKGLAKASLAVDEMGLLPSLWRAIREALPHARIVEGSGILSHTRMVKTQAEIERLICAARINGEALTVTIGAIAPGVTERDLVNLFTSEVARRGGVPMFWMISAGLRSAHVHPLVSDHILQEGDLVKFDVGCTWDLYWADMARTKAVTTVTEEQYKAYEALLAGEQAAIRSIRPGIRAAEVFETAVETVRASGLPQYKRTHCGHGIGITVYDPPLIQASESVSDIALMGRTDMVLEEGMVFCVETPYYVTGLWGMTVEDTVVVEKGGAKVVTSLDHGLVC